MSARTMTDSDIGLTDSTTIYDCLARPRLGDVGLLFADLADINIVEFEAWGEGEVPPTAIRLYELACRVRKELTPNSGPVVSERDPLPPIPAGVHYDADADKFFRVEDGRCLGMGMAFWQTWRTRRAEFPQQPGEWS